MNGYLLPLIFWIGTASLLFGEQSVVLDISGDLFHGPNIEKIEMALSRQAEVEELRITHTMFGNKYPDVLDRFLTGSFQNLKKLTLDDSVIFGFDISASFAPDLEVLSFTRGNYFAWDWDNPGFVPRGLENLPALKVLHMVGTPLNAEAIQMLNGISMDNLEELSIWSSPELFLADFAPNLKVLSTPGQGISAFEHLTPGAWVKLQNVNLSHGVVEAALLEKLSMLPSLTELLLHRADIGSDVDFSVLQGLEKLVLSSDAWVGLGLPFDLRTLGSLESLHTLNLSERSLSAENIEQIAYTTVASLKTLILDGANVRGSKLATLAPNLRELSLMRTNITGGDVAEIALLKDLEVLHIGNKSLTGSILKKLGTLTALRTLTLVDSNMSKADFSELPASLEALDLRGSTLSIASFNTLHSLTHLQSLDIRNIQNANITPAMIDALQEALPNCEIYRRQQIPLMDCNRS